tara:strand:+ start:198 stop:503 length:306 start_codon:yes stop_codon:yes gene_type:complete
MPIISVNNTKGELSDNPKKSFSNLLFHKSKMEQLTDAVGNPTALMIERFFWLGLGGFLGLALITSLIRGLNERESHTKPFSQKEVNDLTKRATWKDKNKIN